MSNERGNLTSQAYDLILEKIINTEFKPGEKISEKKIEETLGIGRTPVREALLQLRQEHLIDVIPQSGTYISKIDLKVVLDARFIRASVERRIMREATSINLTMEQQDALQQIITMQEQSQKHNNFPDFFKYDDQFHRYFYLITDHELVWNWLKKINVPFNRFRYLRLKVSELSWQGLIKEHQAILKALLSKDVNEVDRLTANHMHLMIDEEQDLVKSFPDYFVDTRKSK